MPNPNRAVHPSIADVPFGVTIPITPSPHLAYADGKWNHGEGFPGTASAADSGGWFSRDDGTDLTIADVHPANGTWQAYSWPDPNPPFTTTALQRFVGYLRPASALALPTTHPLYGPLGTSYVDQGAFEIFRPTSARLPGQKILIVIRCVQTTAFPRDRAGENLEWRQIYRGFFSPDGLVRNEDSAGTAAGFLANNADSTVLRPSLEFFEAWNNNPAYWPILAYPVQSVMHRTTSLNEQRHLQLVQAIKLLLQEPTPRNPVAPASLSPADVESQVVVCFTGGSNGGLQSHWATLSHPGLVHGCYAEVINPSMQRMYNEHSLFNHAARLVGEGFYGAGISESDFLWWDQYLWAQGIEAHDISYPRLFAAGQTYRPACFVVGDEDNTSTGTDWVRLATGLPWSQSGMASASSSFGSSSYHTFAWMVAEAACHQNAIVPTIDPYTGGGLQFIGRKSANGLFEHAVAQRAAELALGQSAPSQPLTHQPRTAAQQLRGPDDPHEWFLGRAGWAIPPIDINDPLLRDDAFFQAVQPGACGTMPGGREAMFIENGRVYVGSTEGIVSSFAVDTAHVTGRAPLVRVARSPKLGGDAFALAPSAGSVIVGTRRHLYKLNATSLAITAGPVQLPWEVAQPRHMEVADVLVGSPGDEVIFHSEHGGLVFYRESDLTPIYEWPEPGIVDFVIDVSGVVILSARGVLAAVTFVASGSSYAAELQNVSKAIPAQLQTFGAPDDPPTQGKPLDLELMLVNWSGAGLGVNPAAISSWKGGTDGHTVRGHWLPDLTSQVYLPDLDGPVVDLATCTDSAAPGGVGDHALVLSSDSLSLYNQFAGLVGRKQLNKVTALAGSGLYNAFGSQAHAIAVGELVSSAGTYSQEVVIATNTGLMWLSIDDLVGGSDELPSSYETRTVVDGGTATNVQAHTNASMGAAWAIARGESAALPTGVQDDNLHVMDARGNYWRVDFAGNVTLHDRANVQGARNWDYVGTPLAVPNMALPNPEVIGSLPPLNMNEVNIGVRPWMAINGDVVAHEKNSGAPGTYVSDNWIRGVTLHSFVQGFKVHRFGGSVLPLAATAGSECWSWTSPVGYSQYFAVGQWGNMLEALQLTDAGDVVGYWASTEQASPSSPPNPSSTGDLCPYHALRTHVDWPASETMQSVRTVTLWASGQAETAVVLGCPGGRVRVLLPGRMRDDNGPTHSIGATPDKSQDFGFGGAALAVRHQLTGGQDVIKIWFGTISGQPRRPSAYGSASSVLFDQDVGTGEIHVMEWRPGTGITPISSTSLAPNSNNVRGAHGVIGLEVADLLTGPQYPGDELIVGTLSGDVIVYQADTMTEIWRTWVDGAVGMFHSIRVADLDGDGVNELYLAGSWGLWRFRQPGE